MCLVDKEAKGGMVHLSSSLNHLIDSYVGLFYVLWSELDARQLLLLNLHSVAVATRSRTGPESENKRTHNETSEARSSRFFMPSDTILMALLARCVVGTTSA